MDYPLITKNIKEKEYECYLSKKKKRVRVSAKIEFLCEIRGLPKLDSVQLKDLSSHL